ncbi:MAG TPA: (2Fe-2S) ferredoxin domain-containing protein [Tepidiformaceae bacterium]|jgi:(2Fe-2S) ferredoxin
MGDPLERAKQEAVRRGVGSYERHIFLCTGPDCCTEAEGDAAWQRLKKRVAELNGSSDSGRIYRTKVGCLRICHEGPTAVVYPEGTWYAGLGPEALDRVIDEHLAKGHPVAKYQIGENPLPGRGDSA